MIVEAAFPPGRAPVFDDALSAPHVVPWLDSWIRPGDLGVVAEDRVSLGAAWCRLFTGNEEGLTGFIDVGTPVLAIAVRDGHRGFGIGTALLEALLVAVCADGRRAISLSVGRTNSALRLYDRAGFERIGDEPHGPIRMRRWL
jgi:ribosomal protein S18 acetylase RimI-like enzyme